MKVLVVHNFYGSEAPSGENQAFEAERDLLLSHGHVVREFVRHSDYLRDLGHRGRMIGGAGTPWNPFAARSLRRVVDGFHPDVVHIHNTFPRLSPGIFRAVGHRAARVLTLHNYRLFCAVGIPMRGGMVCTECLDRRSAIPSLQHGCYRSSRLATVPLALSITMHRAIGTWTNQVDAFLALSEFQRQRMIAAGLPPALVHVKPNFFPGNPHVVPWDNREPYVVFAGRLSAEKGIHALLRGWRLWGHGAPELRVLGTGELLHDLPRLADGLPVRFMGQVSASDARRQIGCARLVIVPSECFEGFPMVIAEAFAFGTPVAVSNLGPLPSIVRHGDTGVVFEAGNPESLWREISSAWRTSGMLARLGAGARTAFEMQYTGDANHDMLMATYRTAISVSRRRRELAS